MRRILRPIGVILLATLSAGLIYGVFRNGLYEIILSNAKAYNVFWASLSQILLIPIVFIVFSFYNKKFNNLNQEEIGYYKDLKIFKGFFKGILYATVIFITSVFIYQYIASEAIILSKLKSLKLESIFGSFFQNLGGAGSFEEFFTRGFIFIYLVHRVRMNTLASILITSFIFAVLHLISFNGDYSLILQTFLFAIFANLLYIKYKNIWVVVGYHTIWNTFYQCMVTAKLDFNVILLKLIFSTILTVSIFLFMFKYSGIVKNHTFNN